uniref:Uncharacterized protein n=1 Tax=Chromera velia CCMP2878 TaxID=1169474 RepID=A0A0G4FMD0_9ALVE|eukprot:Cvel_17586.t1-p1 / transcript=Cvel_17586.t1 / gene=Cvel_17586 / organism=Chromera_velia_CCMP2878 / gene_product=hypothetical protein / transcript_product=hypothetical protein / location=Cvel_scaffold1414:2884-5904(+) / protein_length=355 / sequence_SO=supercontig / SO=protein_coding / is_pseudo=false
MHTGLFECFPSCRRPLEVWDQIKWSLFLLAVALAWNVFFLPSTAVKATIFPVVLLVLLMLHGLFLVCWHNLRTTSGQEGNQIKGGGNERPTSCESPEVPQRILDIQGGEEEAGEALMEVEEGPHQAKEGGQRGTVEPRGLSGILTELLDARYSRVFAISLETFYTDWLMLVASLMTCVRIPCEGLTVSFPDSAFPSSPSSFSPKSADGWISVLWRAGEESAFSKGLFLLITFSVLALLPVVLYLFITRVPKNAKLIGPVHKVFKFAYRPEVEWWDVTFMLRRLVLVVLTTLLPPGSFRLEKAFIGLLFFLCLALYLECKPFKRGLDSLCEAWCLSTLVFLTITRRDVSQAVCQSE